MPLTLVWRLITNMRGGPAPNPPEMGMQPIHELAKPRGCTMTRAIVTFGTGRHAEMLEVALPSFRAFAGRHGYRLFVADQIGTKRPPPWYKVKIRDSQLHDHTLFVDPGWMRQWAIEAQEWM
jgi:hypothetical protein